MIVMIDDDDDADDDDHLYCTVRVLLLQGNLLEKENSSNNIWNKLVS